MKVRPLLSKINVKTFIEDLLTAYGIEMVNSYLNPSPVLFEDCNNYQGMKEAYDLLLSTINHENDLEHIYLIQDSDADGVCSAGLLYMYLKDITLNNIEIQVLYHQGKQHGLYVDILEQISDNSLILIPDASVVSKKTVYDLLATKNCFCIETDHHSTNHTHPNVITINNQRSDNVHNKDLSGTGVTFKFCQYIDEQLGCDFAEKYYDMVAVTIVSDICNIVSEENRAFLYYGLGEDKIFNPLLKLMFKELAKDSYTIKDVGWSVAPKINALCRVGAQESKELFFNALVGQADIAEALDVAKKAHVLQTKEVKKIVDELEPNLDLNHNIIVTYIDSESRQYSGLIANKLTGKYHKPALVLRENNTKTFSGSVRSPIDIADIINETKLAQCDGHSSACGIMIKKPNVDKLTNWFDEQELDDSVPVTAIITPKQATVGLAKRCVSHSHLWGQGVEAPLFYITGSIHGSDVNIYQKKTNTIKFNIDGVDFLKFKATDEEVDLFSQNKLMDIEMIVRLETNEWRGKVSVQGLIEDYELVPHQSRQVQKDNWADLF